MRRLDWEAMQDVHTQGKPLPTGRGGRLAGSGSDVPNERHTMWHHLFDRASAKQPDTPSSVSQPQ